MGKEEQEEGEKEDGNVTEKQQCEPKNHVMFLKTHKCGSSTVQNIFLRYAYKRNLTLALPASGNYLGSPNPFQASMVPMTLLPENKLVDIFAVHTRLNYQQHSKVLYRDTKWVTIVREPTALYESLYSFYEMKRYYGFGLANFMNMDLETLEKFPRYAKKLGRNQMLFDFGYSPDADVAELRRALDDLDKIFDLVMVVEFMDESLVLLRHLLCWSQEDVLVFTKNARREKFKSSLDIRTKRVLRTINSADGILYDHFVTRHIKKVLEFGVEKMGKEVAALRALREKYRRRCVTRETGGLDSDLLYPEYSDLVNAYIVANRSDTECRLLSMPEIPLLMQVREAQRRRLHPFPPPPPRARKNEMKSAVDPYEFLEFN
ncbi:galactosylceramide sulfotransferase-like isoform X2 [Macrobrachium nipponense]